MLLSPIHMCRWYFWSTLFRIRVWVGFRGIVSLKELYRFRSRPIYFIALQLLVSLITACAVYRSIYMY